MTKHYDVAIIGSGFSGSILAWILASQGRSVALIDPVSHPRFAIGESSTPIADLLMRRLGQDYGLQDLESLSTYGSWQKTHPEIACGRKRGFSYYVHQAGEEFYESGQHQNSLMVAASANDSLADTHWYRHDVDLYLFNQALRAGVENYSVSVRELNAGSPYRLTLSDRRSIAAEWVIDASGRGGALAQLLNRSNLRKQLATNSGSVFGHFRGVRRWREVLTETGIDCACDPFDTDDAAQHHLFRGGWMWMLRFNNAVTSVGWTTRILETENLGQRMINGYPSLTAMLKNAEPVVPASPQGIVTRLQRLFDPVVDKRCLMLPATACTLDPLHSTGIAHSLSGVQRVAKMILGDGRGDQYAQLFLAECRFLDRLVSTAYRTLDDFPRFTAACMLYFAAAIACEERILAGETPAQFWNADDKSFVSKVDECCERLGYEESTPRAIEYVRRAIEPWNTAGLMDPSVNNRYAYTATKR